MRVNWAEKFRNGNRKDWNTYTKNIPQNKNSTNGLWYADIQNKTYWGIRYFSGPGQIDILIGTQMIAKGLDNSNVTLVGVMNSDLSFNMPDYRASERGFQLLAQVAETCRTLGNLKAKSFQTYNPDFMR